ncbi:MAG: type II toxin-antitoxin system RelE/ParE family toxin [Pseudomonadota bacterium]
MTWKVEFDGKAAQEFKKLSPPTQKLIQKYLRDKVLTSSHPRDLGKPLQYDYAGLWRYRVGKLRVICHIEEDTHIIVVLRIGLRDKIYE